MTDIQNRDDIYRIIERFYEQLLTDPIVGFFFTDLVQLDLSRHLPKITDFWNFQLFGVRDYRGNVYEVHHQLHLKAKLTHDHFHRWLFVLNQTIDSLYTGPVASEMKYRAAAIAEKMAQALASGNHDTALLEGVQEMTPPPSGGSSPADAGNN